MKLPSSMLRNSLLAVAVTLSLPGFRAAAQTKPDASQAQADQSKAQPGLKPLPQAEKDLEAAQEGPEFLRRRQDWFFKPRAFPIGFIPQGARERALQQKSQMYQREGRLSLFAAPKESGFVTPLIGPTSAWFPIGPQPTSTTMFAGGRFGGATSGRVTALVVNPSNPNNVFLGGADGGLWMSTDGGTNWTPITDIPLNTGIPTIAVGALAVDPTSCTAAICTTVYVGTGEGNFGAENVYGEGVLKCTVTAGPPASASCTQDNTFHSVSPLSSFRGGPSIGALAVNRASGKQNILLAGVRGLGGTPIPSGIWCSSDSGATWSRVLPTNPSASDPGTDVAFASDGTAWVALGNPFGDAANNGIYKSSAVVSSCTITFTKQTLPAALTTNIGRITLAIFPSATSTGSNATIYTAIADSSTTSSNLLGVAKTTNGGASWTQLTGDTRLSTKGVCNAQCFYDIPLAVSPASASTVFFGGAASNGTLIRSTDGGSTWTEISRNNVSGASDTIHVDMHAIAFNSTGSVMYVGNDGGVWKTANPTGAPNAGFWTNLNQNLQITQFYPGVSIHPSNTGFAMAGSQDNGIQDYQGFNGTPLLWQDSGLGCDGGFTAIDFSVPSTTYGECEYFPNGILLIATSFNNGDLINGFLATSGIDGGDRGGFIPPLVIDSTNSNALYFGTCRVYKTTNNAQTWTTISPDVTSASHAADCSNQTGAVLSTIAIAKGTSNTIYAGSDGGDVEVTKDGGTTWTSIAANGGVLPGRAVTEIVVDPSNATGDVAYVAFSGFASCSGCDGKGHVFKTVNGTAGATTVWADISGITTKLPDIPVNAIVIDPDDAAHNTLYVGTDIGAFFTTDGGLNWSPLGAANSLPNSQILSLTLHNPSRTLRAAMHGRGVWDINLGAGPNTPAFEISKLSPFSANAPGSATTLTVTGTGFTSSSTVMWGATAKTTTFGSATQLTATITTADLSGGGVVQVSVQDLTLTPNTTNALPFTVLGQPPTISSVSPTSASVNSPNQTIAVTGTNFGLNSQVIMNPDVGGTAITTTFTDSTHLSATIPASFMATFGSTNSVGVQNPPPGGGITLTSATVTLPTFKVVAPAPTNDNFANAVNITSPAFNDTKDSSGATTESNDPTPACSQISGAPVTGRVNTIWYKFAPTATGTASIDTVGSSYDSVLSVWSGTSQTALTAVSNGCNDDVIPGIVTVSQLTNVTLNSGTTYYLMVSSFGALDPNPVAFGGKTVLNFTFAAGADFTLTPQAPTSVTVSAGTAADYTVAVAGVNGFSSNVNLSCSLPAAATTCSVTPASVAPGNNATAKVTTTARAIVPPTGFGRRLDPRLKTLPYLVVAMLMLALLSLLARTRRLRLAFMLPLATLLALMLLQATGCSSGSSSPPPVTGTPAGTYTVTVTGTSGSITHSATVTLVVN